MLELESTISQQAWELCKALVVPETRYKLLCINYDLKNRALPWLVVYEIVARLLNVLIFFLATCRERVRQLGKSCNPEKRVSEEKFLTEQFASS